VLPCRNLNFANALLGAHNQNGSNIMRIKYRKKLLQCSDTAIDGVTLGQIPIHRCLCHDSSCSVQTRHRITNKRQTRFPPAKNLNLTILYLTDTTRNLIVARQDLAPVQGRAGILRSPRSARLRKRVGRMSAHVRHGTAGKPGINLF
jgi:hypothetical protein